MPATLGPAGAGSSTRFQPASTAASADPVSAVRAVIAGIVPGDEAEAGHQRDALTWLDSTRDVYRRARPATPARHLVSYAVLTDPGDLREAAGPGDSAAPGDSAGLSDSAGPSVFLADHRLAGLCLPAGGHVEPGEDPAVTARREAAEELGITADFSLAGEVPVFLTVTSTVPSAADAGHTDVSLWYLLAGYRAMPVTLDPREFSGGRWWSARQIEAAGPARFDPHLGRFLAKLPSLGLATSSPPARRPEAAG